MKEKAKYTEAFRKQALEKVYTRGSRSVKAVAEELNMNPWTLKNWMKSSKDQSTTKHGASSKRPKDWSPAERLELLMESHGLDEEALNAFCREKGIFRHHLQQWRAAFEAGTSSVSPVKPAALRELKDANKALMRELTRKEKALAEAAALLVLQKKYQALWEDKDE
jgi:transposase-like protein